MKHSTGNHKTLGFSLVELIVVVAVVGLLAVFAIPAVSQMLRGMSVTATSTMVADQLKAARQIAISRNLAVEVRFYQLPDYRSTANAGPELYRAVQTFVINGKGVTPISRPIYFSSPVVLSTKTAEGGILARAGTNSSFSLPVYNINYRYVAVQFQPDGSVATFPNDPNSSLSVTNSFVTVSLKDEKSIIDGGNFATVFFDPFNGFVKTYRP